MTMATSLQKKIYHMFTTLNNRINLQLWLLQGLLL